jgi:hypothetical protein
MKRFIRLTESDLVRIVERIVSENNRFVPNDLDVSYNSKNEKILYDFWRSDYTKDFINLTDWLEDNGYGIFNNNKWVPIDLLLYRFWKQHPEVEDDDGFKGDVRFVEWLDENGLEIRIDE